MAYKPNNANGQATMANSAPVVVASDQSTLPVSAASLPLPSGAATSAAQSTGNTSLSSIDSKITAVNTGAVVVSSSALPTGAATSALQTTGNTSLSSIDTKTPAVGQATMAASRPVVIASNQSAVPISGTVTANLGTLNGASTAAKQPALGTAGTASTDVLTVQGITSMTPLKTDGSGVTQPVSIAGNLPVNMTQINGVASSVGNGTTDTGTQRVSLSSDSTGQVKLAASSGTNVGNVGSTSATAAAVPANAFFMGGQDGSGNLQGVRALSPADANGNTVSIIAAARSQIYNGATWDLGRSAVNATNSVGTGITAAALVAQLDDVSPTAITENQFGNVRMNADRSINVSVKTDTIGGATPYSYISTATTNATNVKATSGQIYALEIFNTSASAKYVKLFDKATAPTVGTDTPKKRFLIPAGGGFTQAYATGEAFANGIGFSITGGLVDSDTTATAASDVVINMDYR